MAGHLLGVLEPSIVSEVNRDAGCPPGVTSDWSEKTRSLSPLPNRSPCIVAVKSWRSSNPRLAIVPDCNKGAQIRSCCGVKALCRIGLGRITGIANVEKVSRLVGASASRDPRH